MNRLYLFTIIYLIVQFEGPAYANGKEIFTSNDIKQKGIITLNDIFELSPEWNTSSINGYSNRFIANGLSSFDRQGVIILVNGQKMELSFLDEINLNSLPITTDEIDSLIFISTPTNYKGYFAENGLIEFILKTSEKGFSVGGMQSFGNQVGDPGPFAYTEYRNPNIDKLGFIAGLGIKSKGENWSLGTNLKYSEYFVTDPSIKDRISSLSHSEKSSLLGTNLNLKYNFLNGQHQLIFSYSENNDFFFYQPYANEIPSKRVFRHIGFSGLFPLNNNFGIGYKIIKSINELAEVQNPQDLNFNLKINTTVIETYAQYSSKIISGSTGISFEKYDANRSGAGNDEQINMLKMFFKLGINFTKYFSPEGSVSLTKNNNNSTIKAHLQSNLTFDKFNLFWVSTSYSEKSVNEDLNYYTWQRSGLQVLSPVYFDFANIYDQEPRTLLSLDGGYRYRNNPAHIRLELKGFIRNFRNCYQEEIINSMQPDTRLIEALFFTRTNQSLTSSGGGVKLKFPLSEVFSHEISYEFFKTLSGSSALKDSYQKFPEHKIWYELTVHPVESFTLWFKLRYTTNTVWSEYNFVTDQSYNYYNYKIKNGLLFDASFQKYFWENRVWINLLFKNIFNQREILNPIGVKMGLRFYLLLHLELKSLFN